MSISAVSLPKRVEGEVDKAENFVVFAEMGRKQYDPALVLAGFFGTLLVLKLLLFAQNRPPKLEVMKSHLRTGKPTKLPWVSSFDQVEWETLTPDTSSSSVVERKALRSAGSTDGMTPLELLRIRGEGEYKVSGFKAGVGLCPRDEKGAGVYFLV